MREIGLVQTSWEPDGDKTLFRENSDGVLSFVDLIPSKYSQNLDTDFNWAQLRNEFSTQSLEIKSIQGFLFHGSYSLCSKSELWPATLRRVGIAANVGELLGAQNLIVGAPSTRFCSHSAAKECMIAGLEALQSHLDGVEVKILVENLPNTFLGAFAAQIDYLLDGDGHSTSFGYCFDLGNHFSWFEEYLDGASAAERIMKHSKILHVQANLLNPKITSWIDRFLSSMGQSVASVAIESAPRDLAEIMRDLPGTFSRKPE